MIGLLVGLALYAAGVLAGAPCRGVADNLDFFRVTEPAGIEPPEPAPRRPGLFVQCEYGFVAFEQHLVGARFALDLLIALSLVEVARLALARWRGRTRRGQSREV